MYRFQTLYLHATAARTPRKPWEALLSRGRLRPSLGEEVHEKEVLLSSWFTFGVEGSRSEWNVDDIRETLLFEAMKMREREQTKSAPPAMKAKYTAPT